MRGTPDLELDYLRRDGIIPAYAGNTPSRLAYPPQIRDYPRVCGEHHYFGMNLSKCLGSSPRMRGTLQIVLAQYRRYGIIPAYAGNTLRRISYLATIWDHPRVCGEHFHGHELEPTVLGSSPRMRGTHIHFEIDRTIFGIIPAYAGNTIAQPVKTN